MPRVHTVKKAAKDYPEHGIAKGDTYYWWEFRYGGKRMSKTPPRASQLTQSKMSGAYAAMEGLEDACAAASCPDDIASACREAGDALREVAEEYREGVQNMPEGLQQGQTAQDSEEKADNLDATADELDLAADEIDALSASDYGPEGGEVEDFDSLSEEGQQEMLDEAREIAQAVELQA